VYESTVTVDVDRKVPTSIVGQDSTQSGVNDADQFLATQIKLTVMANNASLRVLSVRSMTARPCWDARRSIWRVRGVESIPRCMTFAGPLALRTRRMRAVVRRRGAKLISAPR